MNSKYNINGDKLIISDIRFDQKKEQLYSEIHNRLVNVAPSDTTISIRDALFTKLSGVFYQIQLLEGELKNPPIINFTQPFEYYPFTIYKNDIIIYSLESIFITFQSSLDILVQLLSTKIPQLPKSKPDDDYKPVFTSGERFGRKGKGEGTLDILEKCCKPVYIVFEKNIEWMSQIWEWRNIIIHRQGYLKDLSYWTKEIKKDKSIIWQVPNLPNGKPVEEYIKQLEPNIINFYKNILETFEEMIQ